MAAVRSRIPTRAARETQLDRFAAGPPAILSRSAAAAASGLFGLALWTAISSAWAPVPSVARDEGLELLAGVATFLVAAISVHGDRRRRGALAAVALAVAVVAAATVGTVVGASTGTDVFRSYRLSFPISYTNATAGLFLVAVWPALVLAARRNTGSGIRGAALGAAASFVALAVLTESKGAALGFAVSVLAVLLAARARLRALLWTVAAVVPAALLWSRLTGGYTAAYTTHELRSMHAAALGVPIAALLGCAFGIALALLDRRLAPSRASLRRVRRACAIVGTLVVAAGGWTLAAHVPHPVRWVTTEWRDATHPPTRSALTPSSHFAQLGSNRYDFWRVGIDTWLEHPLWGAGGGGFRVAYLAHRRSSESPAHAHSLPVELLSEEGLIGFALAAAGFGALLHGLVRRARAGDAVALAALGAISGAIAQACVDRTFSFAALTLPLFVLGGIGLGRAGDP